MATGSQHVVFLTGPPQVLDPKVFAQEQLWAIGKRKGGPAKVASKRAKPNEPEAEKKVEEPVKEAEPGKKIEEQKSAPMEP